MTDAEWFAAARETLGLTQQQLAEALHLTQGAVSHMETGEMRVTRRTRAQVEALLAATT